jgi:hypothetical protein
LEPDDRYETLMEFLLALLDVYPLDDSARDRINELFRHDDHAGDIVPLRRMRRPVAVLPSADPTASAGGLGIHGIGARATGTRALPGHPLPGYSAPPAVKIELEDENKPNFASTSPRSTQTGRNRPAKDSTQVKTLIWWIIIVLIGGQLFWWIVAHLNQGPN